MLTRQTIARLLVLLTAGAGSAACTDDTDPTHGEVVSDLDESDPDESDDGSDAGDDVGGSSSDDEEPTSGDTGQEESEGCAAISLSEGGELLHSRCSVYPSQEVECYCGFHDEGDAEPVSVESVGSCEETLHDECGITETDRQTCVVEEYGVCAPSSDAGQHWRCLCEGATELQSLEAASCTDAAFSTCGDSCDSDAGGCVPGTEPLTFRCECELYGARLVSWDGYGCAELLENTCVPGHGLHQWGSCTNEMGYCDQPDPGVPSWACTCLDGTSSTVSLDFPMEGEADGDGIEPDCGVALLQICGEVEPPEGHRCERTTEGGGARCELGTAGDSNAPEGELVYSCTCNFDCSDSSGASGGSQPAGSCEEAMDLFCGEDGPTCP